MTTLPFDDFDDPGTTTGIDYQSLSGSLLIVEVFETITGIKTAYTPAGETQSAVRVNLTVVDGPQAGEVYRDTLIFPKVLVGQLRSKAGRTVLGRLGLGEAQQGRTAPWELRPASPEDRQKAQAALSRAGRPAPGQSPAQVPSTPSAPPF